MKRFSEACERNQGPILEILRDIFADRRHVLEVASGTGQHAIYFAKHLPHLLWQTSDLPDSHPSIRAWLNEAALTNARHPLALDANDPSWSIANVDAIFCANAVHIMDWSSVRSLFMNIGKTLGPGGKLALYGPYNYGGQYTSPSNAEFDRWLKSHRGAGSGIRDFEAVDELARAEAFGLQRDIAMPSNNRLLYFQK